MSEPLRRRAAHGRGDPQLVGRQLRRLRKERGLSLTEVADATGISQSFLSLVETGKNDITFGRRVRVLDFYGVGFDDLIGEPAGDVVILRAGDVSHVVSSGEGIDVLMLAHKLHAPMTPMIAVYEPGGETSEPVAGPHDQFVYVLEGSVEIMLESQEPIRLRSGDSAYIVSDRPRSYRNTARNTTRVLYTVLRR